MKPSRAEISRTTGSAIAAPSLVSFRFEKNFAASTTVIDVTSCTP
jgi:hypothetical protein